jgi:dienelactone hydrolase
MHSIIGKKGEREPTPAILGLVALSKKKRVGGVAMLKLAATLAIYAALISVSSADQAYLGEKEVRDLIAGNTVHGQGLPRGIQFRLFYDPNGRWRLEQSGTSLSGTWWIKSDGALCVISMAGESCSAIRKNDDDTYQLVTGGKPRAKWLRVTNGNALAGARAPGEEISFASVTVDLGASSFLIPRPREIQPATVSGFLALPAATDPLPAVILMHGCNGISGSEIGWVTTFNGLGIATLVVDSFGRRDISETCGRQRVNFATRMADAFAAFDYLLTNPRIDRTRIAIMGFSLGGDTALRASQLRFQKHFGKGPGRFAAHLAFYPAGCYTRLAEEDRISGAPIRIFHGAADDWTPLAPCRAYIERLRQAGKDAMLIEYPDAHHAFDNPGAPLRRLPNLVTPRNCAFMEDNGRIVDATTRGTIFFSSCWSRGASIGYNAEAHRQAIKDVEAILRPLFGLKQSAALSGSGDE